MTGLKSGSGDDLWGDEGDEGDDGAETAAEATEETAGETTTDSSGESAGSTAESDENDSRSAQSDAPAHPYIVRRAIEDKSVQFEREERLTFFVHDDVADGERELVTELESALGRDVPKFDVREAVYRAALRNREDVLEELVEMGYALDQD